MLAGLVASIASAVLFALAFPPHRLHVLGWIALTPLFVAVRRGTPRAALGFAFLWTIAAAWLIGSWLPRAVSTYYQQPAIVGASFFVFCTSITGAPYYLAFAAAYRTLARRAGRWTPAFAAAAWVAAEFGRGRLFTGTPLFLGNPWGLLGYSQVGVMSLTQVAAATGVYGVSFVLALVSATLAECWLARASLGRSVGALATALLPGATAMACGVLALSGATPPATSTRVAIAQGNLEVGSQWRADRYGSNLDVYLGLTRDAVARARARLVFWPESAMTFFLDQEPLYRRTIGRVLEPSGVQLVAGGPRVREAGDTRTPTYLNTMFLLSPAGEIVAKYDKQYLVPFAEYFPIAGVDVMRRRFDHVRVFAPGGPAVLLPTVAGPAGVLTCNEAMQPEVAAARVAAGATYLVNPANDSWLDDPVYSALQLDIVSLRAVEQRRWLVRASTSGPSALVDPWGRIVAESGAPARSVIAGDLEARTDHTPYARVGDAFAGLCAAVTLVAVARSRRAD